MTFRLTSIKRITNKNPIYLSSQDYVTEENYCTIITGKNGIGKSRLLYGICNMFNDVEKNKVSIKHSKKTGRNYNIDNIIYSYDGNNYTIGNTDLPLLLDEASKSLQLPARIIASTISPFDKFPLDSTSKRFSSGQNLQISWEDTSKESYFYFGTRNHLGQSTSRAVVERIIDSIFLDDNRDPERAERFGKILEFLGYKSQITINYHHDAPYSLMKSYKTSGKAGIIEWIRSAKEDIEAKISTVESRHYGRINLPDDASINSLIEVLDMFTRENSTSIEIDISKSHSISNGFYFHHSIKNIKKYGFRPIIELSFKKSDNLVVDLNDTSSGERSIIHMFLGIGSAIVNNSLIIIDEPEISLHPEWQEKFIPLISTLFGSYKGCHFLIATHSPLLVSQASAMPGLIIELDVMESNKIGYQNKRSADYQLAEVFGTPGFKNEYLAREAISLISIISANGQRDDDFMQSFNNLTKFRFSLEENDPVLKMINAIIEAVKSGRNDY